MLVVVQCAWVVALVGVGQVVAARLAPVVTGIAFTLPALVYVDALLVAKIDRHLPSVVGLLFDAGLEDNRRMLGATDIGAASLVVALVGLAVVAVVAGWADARLAARRRRAGAKGVRRGWVIAGALLTLAALMGLETGAAYTVRSDAWTRFVRAVPQPLAGLGPVARAKGSFRAALRPLPEEPEVAAAIARLEMPATPPPGDVFFFVIESLRADVVDASLAPAMAALAGEALPVGVAVSGGNVTQYGWFSMFTGRPALYWTLEGDPRLAGGSTALRAARRRGWRVEVLSSNDFGYMHMRQALLGPDGALADDVVDESAAPGSPAERDVRVMQELERRASRPHPPTAFVVSLDATHLPYTWTDDFEPPHRPFAGPGHYMRIQTEPAERQAVVNRYRNAVAFVDALLGRFVGALRARGAGDDATLVVTGDHGEEFWEHGLTSHGSELCGAQTRVPLLIVPSRAMRASGDWRSAVPFASTMDAWPTLLAAAGVRGDTSALFAGSSLLERGTRDAVVAGQRYWYRPGRFLVEDARGRAELELTDADHPFEAQEVRILGLFDADDAPLDPGTPSAYGRAVEDRFRGALGRLLTVSP